MSSAVADKGIATTADRAVVKEKNSCRHKHKHKSRHRTKGGSSCKRIKTQWCKTQPMQTKKTCANSQYKESPPNMQGALLVEPLIGEGHRLTENSWMLIAYK